MDSLFRMVFTLSKLGLGTLLTWKIFSLSIGYLNCSLSLSSSSFLRCARLEFDLMCVTVSDEEQSSFMTVAFTLRQPIF